MGSTTPPWRLIEAPLDPESPAPGSPAVAATRTADDRATARSGLLQTAVLVIAALVLAVVAFFLAVTSGSGDQVVLDDATGPAGASVGSTGAPPDAATGEIVVQVTGAVARPGVFRLASSARVADLIDAAGGYGPRVDTVRLEAEVQLAAPLEDGDRIHVPSRDEPAVGSLPEAPGGGTGASLVDLNRATAAELDALPGIGPVTAEKIIAAREDAPFTTVNDLRSRGVLGEKTFERIRELVTAG